jgi:Zn-dependent protease with chaperone function
VCASAPNAGRRTPTLGHRRHNDAEEKIMGLGTILLIVLILLLIGAIPSWPHSQSWGYGPSGVLGLLLIVVVVLLLLGRL